MKNNSLIVGIFVIIAATLGICAVLMLGAKDAFIKKERYVLYFDSDMSGLGPGAPVVFKGVKIGEVKDIRIIVNKDLETSVPVFIELDVSNIREAGTGAPHIGDAKQIKQFLKRGLCARLVTESFVTGKLMIQVDFEPTKKASYHGHYGPEMELPTLPNEFDLIKESLAEIPIKSLVTSLVNSLEGIDRRVNSVEVTESLKFLSSSLKNLESLLKHGDTTLVGFKDNSDKAFTSADELMTNISNSVKQLTVSIDKTLAGVDKTLVSVEKLSDNLDGEVDTMGVELKQTTKSADKAILELEATLAEYKELIDKDSPVYIGMIDALKNFSKASESITAFTEYLNRHPESLIHGKKEN